MERSVQRSGFTLIELLMVVVVIGVLVTLAWPRYVKTVDCRYAREARDTLDQVLKGDQVYRLEHATFTGNIAELPMQDPNRPGDPHYPLTFEITAADATNFAADATHETKGYTSTLTFTFDFDTESWIRTLTETGWPCPPLEERRCA